MNLEKFTDRAKGFLQASQTLAIRLSHQRITPEHILKALLEDDEGMAAGLIHRAGGTTALVTAEVDKALAKIPAVSGGGAQQPPDWTMTPCACWTAPSSFRPRRVTALSPCSAFCRRWRCPAVLPGRL
jgi:ATP-dependent Clp protease ATP-binding subunit ClpA